MGLKEIYIKNGGSKLIKQYLKSGSFFTAIFEFLILGKKRTALEILRLSTQYKTKKKLKKKYSKTLEQFKKSWDENVPHVNSGKIWVCWLQGIENAPELVRKCFYSLKENMPDREIILITEDNINDYVHFPDYIIEKWKKGKITYTHITDLLRLELLINYGGIWIDSTVFCSGSNIPKFMLDSDLFFYQCLKPGRDGHSNYISSWFISAKSNNKILCATKELCYEYWKKNNMMWDYFLLHDFISIVLDEYPDEWKKIIPRDNSTPHILLLRLFDKYDDILWDSIKMQTPFHKLSYKFDNKQLEMKNTFYEKIIKQ